MIYVDPPRHYPQKRDKWCHMATDGDLGELHLFATALGLKRHWFQGGRRPHYDLAESKHALAIQKGAQEVEATELYWRCFGHEEEE